MQKTVLITGTNRGIGLEFVRQYAANGWRVHATARAPERSPELMRIAAASGGTVKIHPLDVADAGAIQGLKAALTGTTFDLLINNAGVFGPDETRFGETDVAGWLETFRVNTVAPIKVLESFAGSMARGAVAATLSSRMGSIEDNRSGKISRAGSRRRRRLR